MAESWAASGTGWEETGEESNVRVVKSGGDGGDCCGAGGRGGGRR